MFDDFVELRPGALKILEKTLNQCRIKSSANPDPLSPSSSWSIRLQFFDCMRRLFPQQGRSSQPVLPQNQVNMPSSQSSLRSSQNVITQDLEFLLLCVPHRRHASKLVNIKVVDICSDIDFFVLLRREYYRGRARFQNLFSLRCLMSIRFVEASYNCWSIAYETGTDRNPSSKFTKMSLRTYISLTAFHRSQCVTSTHTIQCLLSTFRR